MQKADLKMFLGDMVAVRSVSEFKQVFGLQKARERGVQVAREWLEQTGRYDVPGEYLWDLAESKGWPAKLDDWRAHTYIEAACNELDRLAGLPPCWEE